MKRFVLKFALRWLISSLGLWVAAGLLGPSRFSLGGHLTTVAFAGLLLALVNMFIKPLLLVLSFPAIILTLGLFMLVLNGVMILIVSWLYSSLYVKDIGVAVVAGVIVGLVNYLMSHIVKEV
jgi:putative membrane protein